MESIYQKTLEATVNVSGLILGLSIAFYSEWMSTPDPSSDYSIGGWHLYHLWVLIPIWLGEILLAFSIYFGVKPDFTIPIEIRAQRGFRLMTAGLFCLLAAQIISVLI